MIGAEQRKDTKSRSQIMQFYIQNAWLQLQDLQVLVKLFKIKKHTHGYFKIQKHKNNPRGMTSGCYQTDPQQHTTYRILNS